MRVVYVSDLLNKEFNSEEELLAAEEAYKKEQEDAENAKKKALEEYEALKTKVSEAKQVYDEAFDKYLAASQELDKFRTSHRGELGATSLVDLVLDMFNS